MSIRKIQYERIIEEVTRTLYSSGIPPTLNEVLQRVAEYFHDFPVGDPLSLSDDFIVPKVTSDLEKFNQLLARIVLNIDILYAASLDQVDELLRLTKTLGTQLDKLSTRRSRVLTEIDDYLLSSSNTDGYFFSISDNFVDTSKCDLSLTSAHIDTELQCVSLPTLSTISKTLDSSLFGTPQLSAQINRVSTNAIQVKSAFSNATDGLTNTVWEAQVFSPSVAEVVLQIVLSLGNTKNTVRISRFDFDPYGIVPVEMYAESRINGQDFSAFGNKIQTSSSKMSLSDVVRDVQTFRITLRKTKADYVDQSSGVLRYVYIFGAKELAFTEQVYDNSALFVSAPLTIPSDLQGEYVIDAVSLVVDEDVPSSTSAKYYVAEDNGSTELGDFNWRHIDPISALTSKSTIVNFNGANSYAKYIRSSPETGELQLIAPDTTNPDPLKMNPSPSIITAADVYRISSFSDDVPTKSLRLDEGVNTTRIYFSSYDQNAVNNLSFWSTHIANATIAYGRIDIGNDFFYGGDVGESNKSAYVETYLDSDSDQEPFLAEFLKSDVNSQTWDVRVFLNGRDIGFLPVGTDSLVLPWLFKKGLNHIAVAINIPAPTVSVPNPYIGTLSLLGSKNLFDYGLVKLSSWDYVSFFDMQYNQAGQPFVFTIYNGEIISRRKPTDNFLFRYSKLTNSAPEALRMRADLGRETNNVNVTPKLNSYRLRFAYGVST